MTYQKDVISELDFMENKEVLVSGISFMMIKTEFFIYVIEFIQGTNFTSLNIIDDNKNSKDFGEFLILNDLINKISEVYYEFDNII